MAMTEVPARRFGIRAKMFIAFGAVAALPCVAAVIGWLSFAAVKEHVADIIQTQVPLLNAAHGMETTAARLIAFGPLVNAAESPETLIRLRSEVEIQKAALERQIAQVARNESGQETAASMEKSAQSLLTNLNALIAATGRRLELRERRGTRVLELAGIHGRLLIALEPEMNRAKENLNNAIEAMVGVTRQQSAVISEELAQTVLPLFQLRGAASAITKALLIGAIETDRSKVMSLSTDFDSAVSDLQGSLRPLAGSEEAAPVVQAIRGLAAFGDGDAGIYMRRVRQLDPALPAAEAKKLAEALARSVEEIVQLDGTANTRMLPLMLNSRTRIADTSSEIEQQVEELATKVVPAALQSYVAYSSLMAKLNLMAGKLAEAGDADTPGRLAQARKPLEALAGEIRSDISVLGGQATAIGGLTGQLLDTGFGKDGILALRQGELAAYSENAALIERNQSAADSMSATVEGLVRTAEQASVRGAADTQAALERTNDIQMLLASTGVLLSALIVWFYVGRRIVGRLVSLASAMRLVADGELSVKISQSGNDEIADMADTLDVFVANARSMEEARRHVEEERQRAANMRRTSMLEIADQFERNVLASVETLAQAAKVMAERARSLTAVATSASHQADAAMAVSAEMSAGIQQVAVAASEISNSIGEISQRTGESARIIGETAAGAERVKVTVTDLSRTAGEIGAIVGLIEGIAGQTNLLALNATIEAARAGEAGRGFAVVAGEVKTLASQTSNATAEISQQIAATQAASRQTADVVEIMAESVQRIEGNASAIAAAVEEQAAITSGIVDTAHRVASGTQKASEHVSGLSESAATVRAEAGEVLQVAEGLSHEATSLGTAVNLFLQEIRAAR